MTTFRPFTNEHHNSKTNISKEIVVKETIVLSGEKFICLDTPIIKLCTLSCVSITPFGFPVEPEV